MNTEANIHLLEDACFSRFVEFIHSLTGITISHNRKSMVQGRLRKRLRHYNLDSYEDYLRLVHDNVEEQKRFIDLITTNETYFFRTPRIWEYLINEYLPKWHQQNKGKVFRVWSAASSSGEETYSLGIICKDFQSKNLSFKYQIIGSDISGEMIEHCKNAQYSERAVSHFKTTQPRLYEKYIVKKDNTSYTVHNSVKDAITFHQHNLFKKPIFETKFDLVLIRNVLIYFSAKDQELVLSRMSQALATNGTLIIGESESLNHISTNFSHIAPLIYTNLRRDKVSA